MICKNCNADIDDDSKFCTECGSAVSSLNQTEENIDENYFSLFSPSGCVSRKTYWAVIFASIVVPIVFALMVSLAIFALSNVFKFDYSTTGKEILILSLGVPAILLFWVAIATSLKRLRDANFSAWLWWLHLIPYLGAFIIFVLNGFVPSAEEGNRYCKGKNNLSNKAIKLIYAIPLVAILLMAVGIGIVKLTNDGSVEDKANTTLDTKTTQKPKRLNIKNVVVLDGLMWQDEPYTEAEEKAFLDYNYGKVQDWEGAKSYCRDLVLAGYDDWRLPNKEELVSIIDTSRKPTIKKEFKHVASYNYWSSTTYAGRSGNAWFVYFYYGGQYYDYKSNSFYVRCVRAGQ